uniref:Uncharacterized protein n=2 Tax=Cacopsylla melanoneura TaxID=428564 RepID=A0A8D8LVW8_9HEMI
MVFDDFQILVRIGTILEWNRVVALNIHRSKAQTLYGVLSEHLVQNNVGNIVDNLRGQFVPGPNVKHYHKLRSHFFIQSPCPGHLAMHSVQDLVPHPHRVVHVGRYLQTGRLNDLLNDLSGSDEFLRYIETVPARHIAQGYHLARSFQIGVIVHRESDTDGASFDIGSHIQLEHIPLSLLSVLLR